MFSDKQLKQLGEDLPASAVKEREGGGGKALSYVDGYYVIDRMNQIFGPGAAAPVAVEIVNITSTLDAKGRHSIGYVVKVTLEIPPGDAARFAPRTIVDVGFGSAIDNSEVAAHEKASKEAVTDAVKRCCRYLGNSLGLALYDKERNHVDHGANAFVELFESAKTDMDFEAAVEEARRVVAELPAKDKAKLTKARGEARARLDAERSAA